MRTSSFLLTAFALSVPLAVAGIAEAAPVPECGGIDFESGVSCEVKTSGGCTAQCTPINVDVQCAADIYPGMCTGGCNANVDVSCNTSCQANCTGECMANANLDCSADCNANCDADCSGECSSNANQSQCQGTCKAGCSSHCQASCMGSASASCMGKCQASCTGHCTAKANLTCDLMCTPPSAYASCESMVTGGCQAQCSQPKGALFCNGQYVDTSKFDLDKCLTALLAQYNIMASGYAYGSCTNGSCTGNAGGSVNCAVANPGADDYAFGGLGGLSIMGFGLALTRRLQAKKGSPKKA